MAFILGVTGGIASGKTTATDIFQSLGVNVVDADIIARDVVTRGSPALSTICEQFGDDILLKSGELNRTTLREIIFADSDKKAWLESTLHPIIRKNIEKQLANITSAYGILSSPLLFEKQQDILVDHTLVIDCPIQIQQARAALRDTVDISQIERIMQTQFTREERNRRADDVIVNNGDLEVFQAAIVDYHRHLLAKLRA